MPSLDIDNLDELENAVTIDLDGIDKQSQSQASSIVKDIAALYTDPDWIQSHPSQKRRLDIELETLRGLIKMRQSDEQAHDALIQGISNNNNNASLYKALADIQRTSLQITDKINQSINTITNLLEKFQLDMPVHSSDNSTIHDDDTGLTRGSKEFIKKMARMEACGTS